MSSERAEPGLYLDTSGSVWRYASPHPGADYNIWSRVSTQPEPSFMDDEVDRFRPFERLSTWPGELAVREAIMQAATEAMADRDRYKALYQAGVRDVV